MYISFAHPQWDVIRPRILPTVQLGLLGSGFEALVATPVGMFAAMHPRSWKDRASTAGALIGAAVPYFPAGGPIVARSPLHWGSGHRTSGYHPRHVAPGDSVMFELLRSSSLRQLLSRQAPALVLSLVVAEMFYKFGSFTLECLGFLATWFVLDALFALVARAIAGPATDGA